MNSSKFAEFFGKDYRIESLTITGSLVVASAVSGELNWLLRNSAALAYLPDTSRAIAAFTHIAGAP